MRASAPSTLGHLPAWAGITIIVCLVVFLTDLWFAIATGRLIMVGLGALALVIAVVCAMAYWPAEVPERHEPIRGMDHRRRSR
jgi:apolipoprotein N-acyltransferase